MHTRITCLVGLLAGVLPLLSTAQTIAPSPEASRFYVGLGGSVNTNSRVGGLNGNSLAPTLTLGMQLQPRLAVQIGVGYRPSTRNSTFAGQYGGGTSQLQPGYWSSTSTNRYLTIPVLARYTLTRLDRRFGVDMLGGFTARYSSYRYREDFTYDQSQQTVPGTFATDDANTDGFLTLGPSVHYRLGSHFDLTGDVAFNYLLGRAYNSVYDQLTGTLMLGARYRFGKR